MTGGILPRETNHQEINLNRSHIHIGGSFSDDTARILAAAERAEAEQPTEVETHVSFTNRETFFRVLSPTRIAPLRHIRGHDVRGIRALSQAVGRDYRRVHDDVDALLAAGLIERRGTALTTDLDGAGAEIEMGVPA
jgi:predicted transcriptional regulator